MEIERAYKVLNKYYSQQDLSNIRRENGFDASETDTNRM